MRRNSREHSQDRRGKSTIGYIQYILKRRESHSHHHGVHDAIKWFIEIFIPVKQKPHKDEFAELLNQRNFKHRTEEFINYISFTKNNKCFYRPANSKGDYGAECPIEKAQCEERKWFTFVFVLQVNIQ